MKFFCTIYEPFEFGYKVLLNAENINFIPGKETTLRRIFITADLQPGDIIYVSDSDLGPGGKLMVKAAYKLSQLSVEETVIQYEINDSIKNLVTDQSVPPSQLYTSLC